VNRDLEALLKWAASNATKDPDESARPLWRQIAGEISNHLQAGLDLNRDPTPDDHPSLFGDGS